MRLRRVNPLVEKPGIIQRQGKDYKNAAKGFRSAYGASQDEVRREIDELPSRYQDDVRTLYHASNDLAAMAANDLFGRLCSETSEEIPRGLKSHIARLLARGYANASMRPRQPNKLVEHALTIYRKLGDRGIELSADEIGRLLQITRAQHLDRPTRILAADAIPDLSGMSQTHVITRDVKEHAENHAADAKTSAAIAAKLREKLGE